MLTAAVARPIHALASRCLAVVARAPPCSTVVVMRRIVFQESARRRRCGKSNVRLHTKKLATYDRNYSTTDPTVAARAPTGFRRNRTYRKETDYNVCHCSRYDPDNCLNCGFCSPGDWRDRLTERVSTAPAEAENVELTVLSTRCCREPTGVLEAE